MCKAHASPDCCQLRLYAIYAGCWICTCRRSTTSKEIWLIHAPRPRQRAFTRSVNHNRRSNFGMTPFYLLFRLHPQSRGFYICIWKTRSLCVAASGACEVELMSLQGSLPTILDSICLVIRSSLLLVSPDPAFANLISWCALDYPHTYSVRRSVMPAVFFEYRVCTQNLCTQAITGHPQSARMVPNFTHRHLLVSLPYVDTVQWTLVRTRCSRETMETMGPRWRIVRDTE